MSTSGLGPLPAGVARSTAPAPVHGAPPTMVVLGDSLSAGMQDGFTVRDRQEMAYASQIARAAGIPFNNPEITAPGLPVEVFRGGRFDEGGLDRDRDLLVNALAPLAAWTYYLGVPPFLYPAVWDMLGQGVRAPESRSTPERPQHNFAYSGAEARHLTSHATARDVLGEIHQRLADFTDVGSRVPLVRAVLQNGGRSEIGSQVDQAIATRPDLVILWAGGNDALEAALAGYLDDRKLTPVEDQVWTLHDRSPLGKTTLRTTDQVIPGFRSAMVGPEGALTRLLAETSAEILVGTVPDVDVIPNLVPLGQAVGPLPFRIVLKDGTDVTDELQQLVLPNNVRGPGKDGRRVFPPDTRVPLTSMLEMFMAHGPTATAGEFRATLQKVAGEGWFSEDQALDPDEQEQIRRRVQEYNDLLRTAAAANPRVHLVDVAEELRQLEASGRPLRGSGPDVTVTTTYTGVHDARGFDGIFSYDGVHPSDTGHAVVANMFLDHVKANLGHDPRFARFVGAPEVDEKMVYARDPHRNPGQLVLDPQGIQELRSRL